MMDFAYLSNNRVQKKESIKTKKNIEVKSKKVPNKKYPIKNKKYK